MYVKMLPLSILLICAQGNCTKSQEFKNIIEEYKIKIPQNLDIDVTTQALEKHMQKEAHLGNNNESLTDQISRGEERVKLGKVSTVTGYSGKNSIEELPNITRNG